MFSRGLLECLYLLMLLSERGRNRTFNLWIKSPLLCQLSYAPWQLLRAAVLRSGWPRGRGSTNARAGCQRLPGPTCRASGPGAKWRARRESNPRPAA